jgi:GNAT superfamily N-acetyltransferase
MNGKMSDPIQDPSTAYHTYRRGEYTISTDPARLDAKAIYAYLNRSYWASARPFERVELSLRHSLAFGLYCGEGQDAPQVGLTRVITDYTTFAYLCDVYILEEHRGNGLGKWMIETVTNDPALRYIVRFMLATRDAHGLYAQFGFTPTSKPELWMERLRLQL